VTFASAGEDGRITFNRPNGDYLGSLSAVSTTTYSLDFHPKSRILVTGGEDAVVRVWDLKDKKVAMTWKAHTTSVVSVRCSPDEDHVASGSVDGQLFVHNLRNGKTVTKLQQRGEDAKDALKQLAFSPFERSRIAACTDSGKVVLWEASRAKLLASIAAHIAPCSAIAFSPVNAALLLSSSFDKTVKLHDIRARKSVSSLSIDSPATALDMASDGATVAVGTANGIVHIFDLQNAASPLYSLSTPKLTEIESLTFQHAAPSPSSGAHATSSATAQLKTPRNPTSNAVSASQTNNFFAPSPVVSTASQSSHSDLDSILAASSSTPATRSGDLFSPLKAFEAQMSSTPNLHLARPQSQMDFAFSPVTTNVPTLDLNVLSPVHSGEREPLAPSGTPLALLSPAPPTPSSYKYSSRLSSTLFSPLASQTSADGTPTKQSSVPSFQHLSMSPLAHSASGLSQSALYSPQITPRLSLDAITASAFSPLANSSSGLHPLATPSSSSRPLDVHSNQNQRSAPNSPTAPKMPNSASLGTDASDAAVHDGIQWQIIQATIGEMMEGFREEVRSQLQNIHLEVIRQFHIQQTEVSNMLQQHQDTTKQLLDMISQLREENERLRKLY
jgi:protein NEDD1